MFLYFPGYGWLGPSFDGKRSLIPGVMPVLSGITPPAGASWAPGPAGVGLAPGGTQKLQPPLGGSPLAALAGTPLGPALARLLASRPDVLSHLAQ